METSLRCRASAISAFYRTTTQTTLHNQLPRRYHSHKASNFSPKIGCHGNLPQHRWTPIWHTIPTAHPSPQPKQHLDRFSRFCTDDRRVSLYFTMGRPFAPSKLPLPMGDLNPIYMVLWAHPSPRPKRHLDRCSRFCTAH